MFWEQKRFESNQKGHLIVALWALPIVLDPGARSGIRLSSKSENFMHPYVTEDLGVGRRQSMEWAIGRSLGRIFPSYRSIDSKQGLRRGPQGQGQ